jgi:NADP-dependent 3-hydroxy acid dehydrogenase YdfG
MARVTDKTVLIVGASSGIGAQVARRLGQGGNRLVITARRAPELAALAAEIRAAGSSCVDIAADALDPQAAADVVARAVAAYGSIDVALLNAGQGPDMPMEHISVTDVSRVMALNYDTVVNYLIPLIGQMSDQEQGGLIAHTNSLAGLMGIPRQGPYSAAKAAGRTLIDAARVELAPRGIRYQHPSRLCGDRPGPRRWPAQAVPDQHGTRGPPCHPCSGEGTGAGLLPLGDNRAGPYPQRPSGLGLLGSPPAPGHPVGALSAPAQRGLHWCTRGARGVRGAWGPAAPMPGPCAYYSPESSVALCCPCGPGLAEVVR